MTQIRYPSSSPYALTKQSNQFVGPYVHRDVPPNKDDKLIAVTPRYHLRPDLLSYDLYGAVDYWWVFGVRNPNLIRDPIWDCQLGLELWVPSQDYLKRIVG